LVPTRYWFLNWGWYH